MNKKALKLNREFGRELDKLVRMAVMLKGLESCVDDCDKSADNKKITRKELLEIEIARNEVQTRIIKTQSEYSRQWTKVLALGKLLRLELTDNKKGAANHG